MSDHISSIIELHSVLLENNMPIDNVAYIVNKAESKELYKEFDDIHSSLIDILIKDKMTTYPPELMNGAMYNGIRILVFDNE